MAYWSTENAFNDKATPDYGRTDFHKYGFTGEHRRSSKDLEIQREYSTKLRRKSENYGNIWYFFLYKFLGQEIPQKVF